MGLTHGNLLINLNNVKICFDSYLCECETARYIRIDDAKRYENLSPYCDATANFRDCGD